MPDLTEKLDRYHALLLKWQGAINLVSDGTLKEAKIRHFEDSLQLCEYVPEKGCLFDLGSGAGFPGLVLAMARPGLSVTLIESDQKKCTFLSTVSRETKTPVKILNQRIEDVSRETIPDIVTARALASLDKLLDFCLPWAEDNPELKMLFSKGETAEEGIKQAQQRYCFEYEIYPSTTGSGHILKLWNMARNSGS